MKKRRLIFHPLLFAAAPVLYLSVTNLEQIPLCEGLLLAALTVLAALVLWTGAYWLFRRRWDAAACFTSLVVFTFLGYERLLYAPQQPAMSIKLVAWLGALVVVAVWLRRARRDLQSLTGFLNVISLAWVAVIITTGLYAALIFARESTAAAQAYMNAWEQTLAEEPLSADSVPVEARPDIYYIILDGYGRADLLAEIYGYDSSAFMTFLKQAGFYVADQSISNYGQTALSTASALNFTYLDELAQQMTPDSGNRLPLGMMIKSNRVLQFLREQGYQVVAFPAGYSFTDISAPGDRQMTPPGSLTALPMEVLKLTPLPSLSRLLGNYSLLDMQRARILYAFDQLPNAAIGDTPTFVFAHVLAPHPPFVFDADGEPIDLDPLAVPLDGSWFTARYGRAAYLEGYRGQVEFITRQLQATIAQILARARRPTIIVIQGDHGPGSQLDWDNPQNSNVRERMSILNAYYFPDRHYANLYPGISPVNTFRVILRDYFKVNLPLLEDRSFFSGMARPYGFLEVTDQLATP